MVPKVVQIAEWVSEVDLAPIMIEAAYEEVWEWEPQPPVECWGPWETVSRVEDRDPTYYPEYTGSLLFPRIRQMRPVRKVTVIHQRKLFRSWVDRDKGPMGEVARVETRSDYY